MLKFLQRYLAGWRAINQNQKWKPAALGGVVYKNNPYEFGICPIEIHERSKINPLPFGFAYKKWEIDCIKEAEALHLKEIQDFIKQNVDLTPKEIKEQWL